MFITTATVITNLIDEPMTYLDRDGKKVELTLGHVIREALIANHPNEKPGPDEVMDRLELAERCADGDMPVSITHKEAQTIQDFVTKLWPVLIASKAVRLIRSATPTATEANVPTKKSAKSNGARTEA